MFARGKKISLIGVPMDLGADLRGVDMGPSTIRIAGLKDRLQQLGCNIKDLGNLNIPHANVVAKGDLKLKYYKSIGKGCLELAALVLQACKNKRRPLILGGDHSISIGTLAGLTRFRKENKQKDAKAKIGLLWVDAHGDCNTAKTTPSGNIHGMSLAVALGLGDKKFTNLGGLVPMVEPEHTVLFGVRELDKGEKANLKKLGCRVITMREIDERGVFACMRDALELLTIGTKGFHLSFDIDSLDPRFAPGVGTPVPGGLTVREAHLIMELVADSRAMISCELVEVNPVLDSKNATANVATSLLYSAFGGRIF